MAWFIDVWRFRSTFGFWPFVARDSDPSLVIKARLAEMIAERNGMLSSAQRELSHPPHTLLEVARRDNINHQLESAANRIYRARGLAKRFGYDPGDLVWREGSLPAVPD